MLTALKALLAEYIASRVVIEAHSTNDEHDEQV